MDKHRHPADIADVADVADEKEDIKDTAEVQHVEYDAEAGKPKYAANTQLDDAARILAEAGPRDVTPEENRRVLRKIDLYVCLPMCIVYLIQQMDKSSVSYAAVFDLQDETNLKGSEYSWLSSIVWLAALVGQPVSAYALIVFPVKYWIVFNYFAWSVATLCTAAGRNFAGLFVARLFLGLFEATVLPCFILITQMWWTRREQSYRTIAIQVANSLAAIIGPLISYGVGHVRSGIRPYQGIFLTIGAISMGFVPIVAWLLPNSPTTARFLRHGEDRLIALERIRENNMGTKTSKWKWSQVWETYRDPKTWMWAFMFLFTALPSGGFGAFGSLITKGFGFTGFVAVLMQMPTGVIGILTLIVSIWVTNRWKLRFPVIAALCLPPIAGATALTQIDRANTGALIGAYYVAFILAAIQPMLYSWANLNAAGSTKRVVTTATMFVFQCAGNVIGPQVYLKKEAPYYHTGLYVDIACWGALFCLVLTMGAYLAYLNKKQEARRVALGMPAKLKDMSLMATDEAAAYRVQLAQRLQQEGHKNIVNESAFDDLTDFENPAFMYVI